MRFLVCVKQVVDTSKMEVDPATGRLNRTGANSIMNPYDRHALEAALSLKDIHGGTVTVITMGPPQAEAVLLEAVAMGADEIYLLTDRAFGGADTLATSYTLSEAIRSLGSFDMIFCGEESIDSNTAQVGPQIAAMLGIPDISAAVGLVLDGQKAIVTRRTEEASEVIEASLPVLVTASAALNTPRYPSVMGVMKKWNIKAKIITAADLDADPGRIGLKGSPTQVRRVRPAAPMKKENMRIEGKPAAEAAALLVQALGTANII